MAVTTTTPTADLETYFGCAGYEVTDKDGAEIAHNLGSYCANQDGAVHLGFFQDATCSTRRSTWAAGALPLAATKSKTSKINVTYSVSIK